MKLFLHVGSKFGLVKVTGEDAPSYLQSQFSNDVRRQETQAVTYGLWLNRKGKVIADSFILQLEAESFLLFSYRCSSEQLIEKLEENIIADEVELEAVDSEYYWFSVWPEAPGCSVENFGFGLPKPGQFQLLSEGFVFAGRHSIQGNFDFLMPSSKEDAWNFLQEQWDVVQVAQASIEYERINSGIAAIPDDIGADALPHEGELGDCAVSYNKGCYLGQEVMARLKAIGQVQRGLFQVALEKTVDDLPVEVFNEERKVGVLTSVGSDGEQTIGLALLNMKRVQAGQFLALGEIGGVPVKIVKKTQSYDTRKGIANG